MKLYCYRKLLIVLGFFCYHTHYLNLRFAFWCSDLRKAINKILQSQCYHDRLSSRASSLREGQLDFTCPDCKLFVTGYTFSWHRVRNGADITCTLEGKR